MLVEKSIVVISLRKFYQIKVLSFLYLLCLPISGKHAETLRNMQCTSSYPGDELFKSESVFGTVLIYYSWQLDVYSTAWLGFKFKTLNFHPFYGRE